MNNKSIEWKKGIRALIFLAVPFLIAHLIWSDWMNPITYWQKFASLIEGTATVIAVFYIEVEMF